MKAIIRLDVPEWQIGQEVSVYFPDAMQKKGTCELLKEQEAVEPIKDIARNKRCPKCFSILKGKFCHECGQAVKWDE